jgi:hypothetical protein
LRLKTGSTSDDDPEERQRDDVDLGMAEEPEQVLPEDGAVVPRVEDVRPNLRSASSASSAAASTGRPSARARW